METHKTSGIRESLLSSSLRNISIIMVDWQTSDDQTFGTIQKRQKKCSHIGSSSLSHTRHWKSHQTRNRSLFIIMGLWESTQVNQILIIVKDTYPKILYSSEYKVYNQTTLVGCLEGKVELDVKPSLRGEFWFIWFWWNK